MFLSKKLLLLLLKLRESRDGRHLRHSPSGQQLVADSGELGSGGRAGRTSNLDQEGAMPMKKAGLLHCSGAVSGPK